MSKTRKDCFGYKNESDTGCNALKELYCKTGRCNFFKSKEQYRRERERYEVADGSLREDGQFKGQLSIEDM